MGSTGPVGDGDEELKPVFVATDWWYSYLDGWLHLIGAGVPHPTLKRRWPWPWDPGRFTKVVT